MFKGQKLPSEWKSKTLTFFYENEKSDPFYPIAIFNFYCFVSDHNQFSSKFPPVLMLFDIKS